MVGNLVSYSTLFRQQLWALCILHCITHLWRYILAFKITVGIVKNIFNSYLLSRGVNTALYIKNTTYKMRVRNAQSNFSQVRWVVTQYSKPHSQDKSLQSSRGYINAAHAYYFLLTIWWGHILFSVL